MAATEHLVITYTGANEHSGARRPPAVPLGELLDAADRITAEPVADAILTRHPLQAYDPRNLKAGDPSTDPPEWAIPELRGPTLRPFSFDGAALAGARAAAGVRRPVPPLLPVDLPLRAGDDVSLEDLIRFLMHPVRTFLRDRLDVSTPFEPDELVDAIPVSLDSLEVWQVGDHLLRELLAGQDAEAVMTAEQLRGTLPPYRLGERALAGVTEECQRLWTSTVELRTGARRSVDVDVDLGDGRRLTGTVAGVYGTKLVSLGLLPPQGQAAVAHLGRAARAQRLRPRPVLDRPRGGPRASRAEARPHRPARPARRRLAAVAGRAARRGPEQAAAPADRHVGRVGRGARARPARRGRRREASRAAGVGDRPVRRQPLRSPRRTRTPTTSGSSARGPPWSRSSTPACRRTPGRSGSRCCPGSRRWARCERAPTLRHHRPAADRHRAARGQCRHGQDVDDRRARDQVRRRGRRPARADAGRHVRPGRQPGAPRARPRPARRGRAGAERRPRRPGGRRSPTPSELVDAAADLRRRAAPAGPPPGRRRAGRVRRRDDRDDPPVLLDGARLPRGGRRLRLARPAGRGPRRPGEGGRRRPLPAGLRPRRGRAGVHLRRRRSTIARRVVDDPQAHLEPEAEDRSTHGRPPGVVRERRARGDGPPQATARRAVLRRPAQPARRRARHPGVAGGRADAAAVADRAGRRVPGHRPGAVAGARPGVQRPRHDGADRRPQAGHLRVPRRRRHDVPHRGRHRGDPADAVGQLAQRRGAALGDAGAAARGRARRRADRGPRRRGPPHREPAGRGGQPVPGAGGPAAGRLAATRVADGGAGAAADRARPRPRRTPPARLRRHVRRAPRAAARHRGHQLPPRRPRRRPGRAPRRRCPRRDRRWRQRLRDPGGW